jgi:hypothetical protein
MAASEAIAVKSVSRGQHITRGKIILLGKTSLVVAAFVALRLVVMQFGWDFITFNSLMGSFVGGVFFTIGIILAGVVTDFKEAEKIPTELAVLLKALHTDFQFVTEQNEVEKTVNHSLSHVEELLIAINNDFRNNRWHKRDIDNVLNKINQDMIEMGRRGVSSGYLITVRGYLNNIDRQSHRIDSIVKTSFIPAAYTIAIVSISSVMILLTFANGAWDAGGWLINIFIVFVMVSVFLLIRDIDNPFEYGKNTCADVDLTILFRLEAFWKENWHQK